MPARARGVSDPPVAVIQCRSDRTVVGARGALLGAELETATLTGLAAVLDPLVGISIDALVDGVLVEGMPARSPAGFTHYAVASPVFTDDGPTSGCSVAVFARPAEVAGSAEEAARAVKQGGVLVDRLLGVMPGISYVYDITKQANVFSSRQLTELLGYGDEMKVPGAILELFHPDDLETVLAGIGRWREAADGEVITTSYRVRTSSGDYRWMTDHATVFERAPDGTVISMAGTALDCTEEVQAKLRHEALAAEMQQRSSLETVGSLATGIAHDFNNILTVMHGLIDLLREGGENSDIARMLQQTCGQGQSLAAQIVSYAKGGTDELARLDLQEVVSSFASMVKSTLSNGEVMVESDAAPCVIEARRAQIQQLLLNLFVNARQATQERGNVIFSVAEAAEAGRSGVLLRVRDTGRGMSPEVAARMCEPYFTTRAEEGGSGIGMAVVRRVIDNHDGEFRVTSALGEGTTVDVWLPASGG